MVEDVTPVPPDEYVAFVLVVEFVSAVAGGPWELCVGSGENPKGIGRPAIPG